MSVYTACTVDIKWNKQLFVCCGCAV